jgi:hypothetical protein
MDAKTPLIISFSQGINPATALMVDFWLFQVPIGAEYEIVEATEEHTVAGTDGGAVTLDLKVTPAATVQAPASGTSVLSSTFNLKSTANTPVRKDKASGLASTLAGRTLRSGDRLGVDLGGTLTALGGMRLTVSLVMRRPPINR